MREQEGRGVTQRAHRGHRDKTPIRQPLPTQLRGQQFWQHRRQGGNTLKRSPQHKQKQTCLAARHRNEGNEKKKTHIRPEPADTTVQAQHARTRRQGSQSPAPEHRVNGKKKHTPRRAQQGTHRVAPRPRTDKAQTQKQEKGEHQDKEATQQDTERRSKQRQHAAGRKKSEVATHHQKEQQTATAGECGTNTNRKGKARHSTPFGAAQIWSEEKSGEKDRPWTAKTAEGASHEQRNTRRNTSKANGAAERKGQKETEAAKGRDGMGTACAHKRHSREKQERRQHRDARRAKVRRQTPHASTRKATVWDLFAEKMGIGEDRGPKHKESHTTRNKSQAHKSKGKNKRGK
ncbi:hypothetical protein, conserved in T.vivax [Trypanosoma vivax Y486]|uniref:Uncharacterized protein n=1 Tax=Trypanosoma vivax (strain Y486) TaxID=1055687 RepID=F9WNY7_TRYVY|nr:hypothetical protein, conserved in T.vivax [Trypanosoma vivax Y486]|eukprot:CCD19259.1 hypothetical protein, conserved in T.vivax [Trypanosoma vivax Y486]